MAEVSELESAVATKNPKNILPKLKQAVAPALAGATIAASGVAGAPIVAEIIDGAKDAAVDTSIDALQDKRTQRYLQQHPDRTNATILGHGLTDRGDSPDEYLANLIQDDLVESARSVSDLDIITNGYQFETRETPSPSPEVDVFSIEKVRERAQVLSDSYADGVGLDAGSLYNFSVDTRQKLSEEQSKAVQSIVDGLLPKVSKNKVDPELVEFVFNIVLAEKFFRERSVPDDERAYDRDTIARIASRQKIDEEMVSDWISFAQDMTNEVFRSGSDEASWPETVGRLHSLIHAIGDRNKSGSLDWEALGDITSYSVSGYSAIPDFAGPSELILAITRGYDFDSFVSTPPYVLSEYIYNASRVPLGESLPDPTAYTYLYHAAHLSAGGSPNRAKDFFKAFQYVLHPGYADSSNFILSTMNELAPLYADSSISPVALRNFLDYQHRSLRDTSGSWHVDFAEKQGRYLSVVNQAIHDFDINKKDQTLFFQFVLSYIVDYDSRTSSDTDGSSGMRRSEITKLVKVFLEHKLTIREHLDEIDVFSPFRNTVFEYPQNSWEAIGQGIPIQIVKENQDSIQHSDEVFNLVTARDEIAQRYPGREKSDLVDMSFTFLYESWKLVHPDAKFSSFLAYVREYPEFVDSVVEFVDQRNNLFTDSYNQGVSEFFSQQQHQEGVRSIFTDTYDFIIRQEDVEFALATMDRIIANLPDNTVIDSNAFAFLFARAAAYHRGVTERNQLLSVHPAAEDLGFGVALPIREVSMTVSHGQSASIADSVIRINRGTVVDTGTSSGFITFAENPPLTAEQHRGLISLMDVTEALEYANNPAIVIYSDHIEVIDPINDEYQNVEDLKDHFADGTGDNPVIVGTSINQANAFIVVANTEIFCIVPVIPPDQIDMSNLSAYFEAGGWGEVEIVPVTVEIATMNANPSPLMHYQ